MTDEETYSFADSVVFYRSKDKWGAFGNMAGGYPITCSTGIWKSSEALYQAARFPDHPEIQEAIRNATNGFTAKLVAKSKAHYTRDDWLDVRVECMLGALNAKIASNPRLWDLLAATGDRPIVERSKYDQYWGTVVDPNGLTLTGRNILGHCWMHIRKHQLPLRVTVEPHAAVRFPNRHPMEEFYAND